MLRIRTETAVGMFMLAAISIFFYMSFQVGAFRFDRNRYHSYLLSLADSSGLTRKSEVKIAGVKVGWVDEIVLGTHGERVTISVLILKEYILHEDAYGLVRQEGLLGSKYLEIMPGNPLLPVLAPGAELTRASQGSVSMDDLLHEVRQLTRSMTEVTESFRQVIGGERGVQRLADTFDNVTLAADRVAQCAQSFELSAQPLQEMVCKLNTSSALFDDMRVAVAGVKNFFTKTDRLSIVFDSWFEPMQALGNRMGMTDGKGYFNIRIHPADDYFYLAGYVGVTSGVIRRFQKFRRYYDGDGKELIPGTMVLTPAEQLKYAPQKDVGVRQFNVGLWNVQFGKIFGNFAFRFGIFDSTAGLAVDVDIPFRTDKFRWVTTLEAFDFHGANRFGDDRPHLKWLNRLFFTQNLYGVFGADDFISRHTKQAFVGAGIRFADDDIKYFASKISVIL